MKETHMRMVVVLLGFVLAGGGAVAQTTTPAEAVVASYLEIHAALANDSLDGVPAAAERIAAQAPKLGATGELVARTAKAVAAAGDIKAARTAFGPLSDAVIDLVKTDPSAHDVQLAYCAMADAHWLQKDEKIRNPYYGSSMLTCGEFRPIDKQAD
jgi:hypothetical protein